MGEVEKATVVGLGYLPWGIMPIVHMNTLKVKIRAQYDDEDTTRYMESKRKLRYW